MCSSDLVLVVDADPQANASSGLGVNIQEVECSLYECIIDKADVVTSNGPQFPTQTRLFHISKAWEMLLFLLGMGFSGGSDGKESVCDAGDLGLIPESRRSLGEGNGYPLQYSCLENSMDRRAWQAAVHEFTKRLSD